MKDWECGDPGADQTIRAMTRDSASSFRGASKASEPGIQTPQLRDMDSGFAAQKRVHARLRHTMGRAPE